jgi:ABC-2 type transport system ATP-binding protein
LRPTYFSIIASSRDKVPVALVRKEICQMTSAMLAHEPTLEPLNLDDLPQATSTEIAVSVEGVSKLFVKEAGRNNKKRPRLFRRENSGRQDAASASPRAVKRVVDNVTLFARRGECLGVLGPNGCGKSTLVRMISTLLIPDEGRITVFGMDVTETSQTMPIKRMINRVSVDAAFFKKLSAMENLLYTARLYAINADQGMCKARTILDELGFDADNLDSSMEQLSRGQQQKVAIARAFLTSPRLVLLDEPTTGLDPKSKKEVAAFINRLREEQDITLLLTTHDMMEAELLCDRIAILNRGKMVALGTALELKLNAKTSEKDPLPSLEDVFLQLAGQKMEEADEIEE